MSPSPDAELRSEAERVRASGVLGDSRLLKLFDYLVASSLDGRAPKEIAIAMDVFGKDATFDVTQDALVRVYIHKLRRALADFYSAAGNTEGPALHIPRREYRLAVSRVTPAARRRIPSRHRWLLVLALAGIAVPCLAIVLWLRPPASELDRVRSNPLWSWILDDDRPIVIVVGDYYLVGETDASMEVKRLIREYSVNSKGDLDRYVKEHPEAADRYIDVGLRYMPTAAAYALRDVVPILSAAHRRIAVSMMSDVNPVTFKSANIVYIGYLSGMGLMKDLVFARSRLAIGDSYDELIDKTSKQRYVSQTASQNIGAPKNSDAASSYRDYGYFSSFRGPDGNTIVIISGTRDEGVRQTAEAFTDSAKLRDIGGLTQMEPPFEALLEVTALDGVNLAGKLVLSSRRPAPAARGAAPVN